LPIAEFCYNNTKSETTKVTPFYANYAYHPHFEPDLGGPVIGAPEVSEYVSALTRLHAELWAEITYTQRTHAEQANKAHHPDPILGTRRSSMVAAEAYQDYPTFGETGLQTYRTIHYTGKGWLEGL
jgi:hypothetical protein